MTGGRVYEEATRVGAGKSPPSKEEASVLYEEENYCCLFGVASPGCCNPTLQRMSEIKVRRSLNKQ